MRRVLRKGGGRMKAVLVFIDGTICDTRGRHEVMDTPEFYQRERVLEDRAVDGSARCLTELAGRYEMVYMGARPEAARGVTEEWLEKGGFPKGAVYLAENQEGRLALVEEMTQRFDFIAGIGDRWDDNELHEEIGCASILVKEFEGKWDTVAERVTRSHRRWRIEANRMHLKGKVEGLSRVCPLLLAKYGEALWDAYFGAVMEMAEASREARREEDLAVFAQHGLDPNDLRDAARLDERLREEEWENNTVYGLQEFEVVEATRSRYVHHVKRCEYAEMWKQQGKPEIGYQIHCRTDKAWWDRPAWNPEVRFEQPKTIMQGDECCVFIQYLPEKRAGSR